jgi:parallel beta-helix repeat protein
MRRVLSLLAALAAAITVLALTAGQAAAQNLRCGDVITQDTVLQSDLTNCEGNGIEIGASNVTLDLNGHTISGTHPQGVGPWGLGPFGIGVQRGLFHPTGIVIEDGIVQDFAFGVTLQDAQAAVRNMTFTGDRFGIWSFYSRLEASGNDSHGLRSLIEDGTSTFFHDNTFEGTGAGIEVVTHDVGQGPIQIVHNDFGRDSDGVTIAQYLLAWYPGSFFTGFDISDNRFTHSAYGIATSCAGTVTRNVMSHVGDDAVFLYSPENKTSCRIADNTITEADGDGIALYTLNATVSGNTITGSRLNGILVGSQHRYSPCSQLPCAAGTPPEIQQNQTRFNGALGIDATLGATGGSNWAKHNGNPLQCVPAALCSTTGKPRG